MGIKWNKVKAEVETLKTMPDGQPMDWLKEPWNTHHWVDIFKESCEHAPYLMGHVYAVYVPVSLLAIILLW